jgi:hypothetical protein
VAGDRRTTGKGVPARPVVLSVLIAVHMIGVDRTLAAADRTRNEPWPMVFLYGAVMMSATAWSRVGDFDGRPSRPVGMSPGWRRCGRPGRWLRCAG